MEDLIRTTSLDPILVTWAVAGLLVLAGLWLLLPWFNRKREQWRMGAMVKRLGPQSLRNVILDDGMDGVVFIEHLVLTADAIVVLHVMRMRGAVFGGDGIDRWAQVVDSRTFKFSNPVEANIDRVAAVRAYVPDAPVKGKVLFVGGATFPKGRPESVILPEDIPDKRPEAPAIPEGLQCAWDRLTDEATRATSANALSTQALKGDGVSVGRVLFALLSFGGAAAWVAWRAGAV